MFSCGLFSTTTLLGAFKFIETRTQQHTTKRRTKHRTKHTHNLCHNLVRCVTCVKLWHKLCVCAMCTSCVCGSSCVEGESRPKTEFWRVRVASRLSLHTTSCVLRGSSKTEFWIAERLSLHTTSCVFQRGKHNTIKNCYNYVRLLVCLNFVLR